MKDNLKLKGIISLELIRDGKVIDKREIKNTITNAGLALIASLAGDAVAVPFTYLAVGTGTTASDAGDTALETEITDTGLERSAATVSQETTTVTDDTLQLLKSWTATGAKAVTEAGALNAASVGTLLGRQVFAAVNTATNDVLQLTYKFIFAGA